MKITEASDLLNDLISLTDNKSEQKVYQSFNGILTYLINRDLSQEEVKSIENELSLLKLKEYPVNKKKYLRRKLNDFKTYLNAEFSFVSEGYYTGIGMSLGMTFGVALGASFIDAGTGTGLGLSIGMLIGLIIGRIMDDQAEKDNRVLKLKLQ
jgi:hypothetical protein